MRGFGKAIVASVCLLVSFLSLLAVIVVANRFGFETAWIRDPERVLNAHVMLVVVVILVLPMLLIGGATKWLFRRSLFVVGPRAFSMLLKGGLLELLRRRLCSLPRWHIRAIARGHSRLGRCLSAYRFPTSVGSL